VQGAVVVRVVMWVGAILVAGSPALAAGQTAGQGTTPPAPTSPTIKVGVTIFADYTVVEAPKVRDAAGRLVTGHEFSVMRSYINVTGSVTDRITFRITPDIVRQTDGSVAGSLMFRLKFAYFNVALPHDMSVRAGMQQTPFVDGQESVYRYRFQGLSFSERDAALASADIGLSWRAPLGKYGDVHVGVYNGEGFNKPEVNEQKALMARVTVRPLPDHDVARGLRLTGYYHGDAYVKDAPRTRAMGTVWFEHARFNAGMDLLKKVDQPLPTAAKITGEGLSVFVTPFFDRKGRGLEGLLRMDFFDPNVDVAGSQRRLIAGVAYWFPKPGTATAALLANVEQLSYRGGATPRPTDRKFGVHALITF
jgi:hypothetical protein